MFTLVIYVCELVVLGKCEAFIQKRDTLRTRLFLSDFKESEIDPSHARRVRWVVVQVLTENRVRTRQQIVDVSHGVPELSDQCYLTYTV